MKWLVIILIIWGTTVTDVSAEEYNFEFIDEYLTMWDRFANGENDLVPYLKENNKKFEAQLAAAISANDNKAPARMVFYPVVQVGGFIPKDTHFGKAVSRVVGEDFPSNKNKEGLEVYFAGNLYFWWQENKSKYESYSLFDDWMNREFAKQTVIPMYTSTVNKR